MILWMIELGTAMIGLGLALIVWGKISNRKPEAER